MKICFVWVKKFRNFEDFGLNTSSSYKFKYNSTENIISKKYIKALPESFFGNKISDVIGIIGKNGVGKSNAIELICKTLKGAKSSFNSDFFIIIEENKKLSCHYSFSSNELPKADFNLIFEEYKGNINPLKVVFFSNVFDERRNNFDNEVTDISVNNQFVRNLFRREELNSFQKQIKLIDSNVFELLNIELPSKVQLISKIWVNRLNLSSERDIFGKHFEILKEFKKLFRERIREIKPDRKFIHLLRYCYFIDILHEGLRKERFKENSSKYLFENLDKFIESLFTLRTEDLTLKLITYIESELKSSPISQLSLFFQEGTARNPNVSLEKFERQLEFLKDLNIKYKLSKINLKYYSEGIKDHRLESFTFNYDSIEGKSFINELITLFEQTRIFDLNWLGISSGHKAYLNLFASLYQELKRTKQNNLLLCIDEGDLYLHPKWQIEFFDKLLEVLPKIFNGNIQLILSSHSPFLLSDLPNQNITILDNSVEGKSLDGIDLKINTFGGNLYDLYSEPFFLGDKRTSDFAFHKIREQITLVENKDLSEKDKSLARQVSKILGDEILQFRISKILGDD